jgi:eukaryotic-like serine/threonine-protein kinase
MQQRTLAGRYQLQRALGQGAIGQVWLAWDSQTQRTVAVKTIQIGRIPNPEHLMDTLGRFQREVAAANKLQHPNIVAAFDSGRTEDELYLVMELADGGSLAELIEQRYYRGEGQWPVPDVLTVAGQVCAGLSAAHAAEIVHRDIKPSNLMIDANQRVKIIDFGMALLLDDRSPRLTRQGQAVGTLAYMPPEQIDGADVDGRTDLYSLGCVMYELFAGQRPFNAETPEALMIQHLYHQPPPLRSFRPDLSEDLAQLIEQMLAKEKEHRPSGAREVFARIGAIGVAVENLESSRVTMLAPDPVLPPSGFDVFNPESGRGTMLAPDPNGPPAFGATQESEPAYRATQESEPVYRGTELAEPAYRGTELAEPVYRGTELAEPVYRGTELAEPVYRGTELAEPVYRGTELAEPVVRGGPAAESPGVVRFGPGLPQEPPGGRSPASPSQPSWPDRQQIDARQREARQSQSPQRRPGRGRQWLLTISAVVVVAAIAAVAFLLLHRSHAALKVTAVAVAPATLPGHKCNITVDVVGTIETNGDAGQLMYQWVRNGDRTSSVFTVNLTAANGTSVTAHLHWRFVGKGVSHATAQLRVLSPNVASAKTAFVYACRS